MHQGLWWVDIAIDAASIAVDSAMRAELIAAERVMHAIQPLLESPEELWADHNGCLQDFPLTLHEVRALHSCSVLATHAHPATIPYSQIVPFSRRR